MPRVQIEGIVTFYEPSVGLFVQDETAGIFIYTAATPISAKPGQYVSVSGFANRGHFSPIIDSPTVTLLSKGRAIAPRTVSISDIFQGALDAQWVEVSGIVRSQKAIGGGLRLDLVGPMERLTVWVPHCEPGDAPKLEACGVKVRGVVGTQRSDQGQLIGFQIFANSVRDIQVTRPWPGQGYPLRHISIRDLQNPGLRKDGVGRVRVSGVVTLCWPQRALFIQDLTGGLEIHADEDLRKITPGELVEATGYLGSILREPLLEDVRLRELGADRAPRPLACSASELVPGSHAQELVQIEATFLQWANTVSNSPALALTSEGRLVTALLDLPNRHGVLEELEPGARVRLTGVCRTRHERVSGDASLVILLRSAQDVSVIEPGHSPERAGSKVSATIAGLAGIGLLVALWYSQKQRQQTLHVLQLQTNLQAEMRQGEQQLRRSMDERDRIARDLHDDIIQSIYAVGLNLEDCRRVIRESPQNAEARLGSAVNTLNNTIRSVRGFLSGLEPKVLNGHEFRTALKSLALTSGDGPTQFALEVDPAAANSLTSVQATQLLHIAKEAMSNSLRHAQASNITVSLSPLNPGVRLEIRDNGTGFNAETVSGAGHGLRNMTSRARDIGADLRISSAPGQGCRIVVTLAQRKPDERL